MKKQILAAILMVTTLTSLQSQALISCKETSVPSDVTLTEYLRDYASGSCAENDARVIVKELGVDQMKAGLSQEQYIKIASAWFSLSKEFYASNTNANVPKEIQSVNSQLGYRAYLAGSSLFQTLVDKQNRSALNGRYIWAMEGLVIMGAKSTDMSPDLPVIHLRFTVEAFEQQSSAKQSQVLIAVKRLAGLMKAADLLGFYVSREHINAVTGSFIKGN